VSDSSAGPRHPERRLAAVMAMDVVGYSRLTEADGEGTHQRLRILLHTVIDPNLAEARGRIVKRTGDGALVEFPSVSEAIRCAVRIQVGCSEAERNRSVDKQLRFRIGINLGDIMVEPEDIYGDGVNIAARLEALAQPGDVIISESAVQTADRVGYSFVDLGVHRLKNISRPVRVYRVVLSEGTSGLMQGIEPPLSGSIPGFGARPAIAITPFYHHDAGDAEQEAFADGLTTEVITALSRWRAFPVISRNSVFVYKGKAIDSRTVGQQLGARYVVEGDIRRAGHRVRTSVHLTDSETSESLLAEHFDFSVQDVFEAQDDIARSIVGALEPELLKHERERAVRVPPQSANAYECYQRGLWHHYRYNKEDNQQACTFFRRALEADPGYAHAAAALAISLSVTASARWTTDPKLSFAEALTYARAAAQADPRDPMARYAQGLLCSWHGMIHEAIIEFEEAIRLDPSYVAAHANLAYAYNYLNRHQDARASVELALRLSRHDPRRFLWLPALSISHYLGGRYREALAVAQEALTLKPDYPVAVRYLLASLGQLGLRSHAATVVPLMRRLDGSLAQTEALMRTTFVDAAVQHIVNGLRKAGYE
jgi:adenylate cyclase